MNSQQDLALGVASKPEIETVQPSVDAGKPSARSSPVSSIPRGIEVLVKKASVDGRFGKLLLKDRSKAAEHIALSLDETESAIINSLPEKSLANMINKAEVPKSQRIAFRSYVAAVMLAALGVMTTPADAQVTFGILPDKPGIKPILKWQAKSSELYDIYISDDLQHWQFMANVQGIDGLMTWTDLNAYEQDEDRRFYKIQVHTMTDGITPGTPIKLEIACEKIE